MTKENEVLKTIAHMNNTAVKVFTDWAMRQRHRGAINIAKNKRSLRNAGEVVDDAEYNDMIVALQKAGYGKLIKDHKGVTRYFDLTHPIYKIGQAAIEDKPLAGRTIAATRRATHTKPRAALVTQVPPKNVQTNTVVYCVVGNKKVRLELEGDINKEALDKILTTLQDTAK